MSRPMMSAADMVVAMLADAERDLIAELHAVREALHASLDLVRQLGQENRLLSDRVAHLCDEIRTLRPAPSKRRAA